MKIVSFNINGLRARPHQLEALIAKHQPDVIGLQETKVADEQFPEAEIRQLGYHVHYHGQKGHYGVALLSRQEPLSLFKGFPNDDEEAQRRFIYGTFADAQGNPVTVMNGYFPQGESRDHPVKFPAKARFYADLQVLLEQQFQPSQPLVVMGDINISPEDCDIGIGEENRKRWLKTGKCSFLPEEREWLDRLKSWGLVDSFRHLNPEVSDRFSWFDYRSRGFEDNPKRGLRIDVILASQPLQARLKDAGIDYDLRGMEKPSDHAPIWLELA
ncbi:exodeoxyribonuclease III [Pseudomonas sp. Q1-7]|uniref:exodeoxyribonuclease III n=1 Tax=Pseudomonas sp. Q1-7 TaxID=3020843 RepID=UPI002301D57E|nr:exodeoxyribonuclease III [Pseudomonas sp. Q1-7]